MSKRKGQLTTIEAIQQALVSSISDLDSSASTLWVGFSAGVDSTVLLHALALASAAGKTDIDIKAIHVHHGLSLNADAWSQQAQVLCAELSARYQLNIECIIERVQLDNCGGLEQAARQARYQVFEKLCQKGDVLFQGHHLDDQVETFFMRAIRGSGLTGLTGIPKQRNLSRSNNCQIVRPLLGFEKNQILEYAHAYQLHWVEDESNQDPTIDRNWWRTQLLPQIWQRYPDQKHALIRTLDTISHEHHLLQQLLNQKLASYKATNNAEDTFHSALKKLPYFDLQLIQGLDSAVALSYVRAWLSQYVDVLPSAMQMKSIYVDMIQAREDAEPNFKWADSVLYRYRDLIFLVTADPLITGLEDGKTLPWQGAVFSCPAGELICEQLNRAQKASATGLKPGSYALRLWQSGDVAKPFNRSTRKMKKWWQDYKVPSWARPHWPLIIDTDTGQIAAVPGLFICHNYIAHEAEIPWLCHWQFNSELTSPK